MTAQSCLPLKLAHLILRIHYVRDVAPGEMVVVDSFGVKSYFPFSKRKSSLCILSSFIFPSGLLYFWRIRLQSSKKLGEYLSRELPVEADVVIPVP